MRKIMEKVMGMKKDGGQEVLITLGLVAVGVTFLLVFMNGGDGIVDDMILAAKTRMATLFSGIPINNQ